MNKQMLASVLVSEAVLSAIPAEGIPNGHLYAALMGRLTLDQYQGVLAGLKRLRAISEENHYLSRGTEYDRVLASLRKAGGIT